MATASVPAAALIDRVVEHLEPLLVSVENK